MIMSEGQGSMQSRLDWALEPIAEMSAAEFHVWQALLEERAERRSVALLRPGHELAVVDCVARRARGR